MLASWILFCERNSDSLRKFCRLLWFCRHLPKTVHIQPSPANAIEASSIPGLGGGHLTSQLFGISHLPSTHARWCRKCISRRGQCRLSENKHLAHQHVHTHHASQIREVLPPTAFCNFFIDVSALIAAVSILSEGSRILRSNVSSEIHPAYPTSRTASRISTTGI